MVARADLSRLGSSGWRSNRDEIHSTSATNFVTLLTAFLRSCREKSITFHGDIMPDRTEKRAKFVKLAEGRTQLALDAIRKIGNLSNARAYAFSDEDVKAIVKALREATAEIERKFSSSTGEIQNKFKLKG
jgi:hypothetical protein